MIFVTDVSELLLLAVSMETVHVHSLKRHGLNNNMFVIKRDYSIWRILAGYFRHCDRKPLCT